MPMMMNSKYVFSVFHPEYLVDLLRAGGRFPAWQAFPLPAPASSENEIKDFIDKRFPPLSEERHEIWLKFLLPEDKSSFCFSLEDVESAHFYSTHRQEAVSPGVMHTLNVYGIPIGKPLDIFIERLIEVYSTILREQTAATILKAWFPEITISQEFIDQLKIGYTYQQSPAPEKLPPIPSKFIWAHMVAYNPGLRKFDEKPEVLGLQDIQEVIRRTDANFKQELKSIGDKYSSKFSDLVDDAERSRRSGVELSKWLLLNRSKKNTYLFELDKYLSNLGKQKSFFYTALLYLYWREKILDTDFTGKLADHKVISYFFKNTTEDNLRQSVAEALFTIVYAGGPRVFQKALIEARMKILNLPDNSSFPPKKGPSGGEVLQPPTKPLQRIFNNIKKELGKIFENLYKEYSEEKKKEILKKLKGISLNKIKTVKGDFNHDEYIKLCSLFEVQVEQFEDQTNEASKLPPKDYVSDIIGSKEVNEIVQPNPIGNLIEEDDKEYSGENIASSLEIDTIEKTNESQFGVAEKPDSTLHERPDISDLNTQADKLKKPGKPKGQKKSIKNNTPSEQEFKFPGNEIDKANND